MDGGSLVAFLIPVTRNCCLFGNQNGRVFEPILVIAVVSDGYPKTCPVGFGFNGEFPNSLPMESYWVWSAPKEVPGRRTRHCLDLLNRSYTIFLKLSVARSIALGRPWQMVTRLAKKQGIVGS